MLRTRKRRGQNEVAKKQLYLMISTGMVLSVQLRIRGKRLHHKGGNKFFALVGVVEGGVDGESLMSRGGT